MKAAIAFLTRKLRGAKRYSAFELSLVLPAMILLGLARLAILLLPFRYYSGILGAQRELGLQAAEPSASDHATARSIGRSVRATASVTPWNAVCLPQAMAASMLLRCFGIASITRFGLAPGEKDALDKPMEAHAWVEAGGLIVTGGPVEPRYRVVACFRSGREE